MLKISESNGEVTPARLAHSAHRAVNAAAGAVAPCSDQELWSRVKLRLRTEVGEDIFSSWFARMDLEGVDGDAVRFSVPTRFLKSWIQAHYAERLLACCRAEQPMVRRLEVVVRSAVL